MMSDPGFLTLFSSFIGAALFFCAGVFWNERPAPSRNLSSTPRSSHAPELFGVDASALSNSGHDLGTKVPKTRPITPLMSPPSGAPPVLSPASRAPISSDAQASAPEPLDDVLAQLQARLNATSIALLSPEGLLYSEGEDEIGAGARLCTMLSVQNELPQDEGADHAPQAFVLGSLRLQRVPQKRGPEAWLAMAGANRFAALQELDFVDQSLAREL